MIRQPRGPLRSALRRLIDAGRFPRGPAYLGDHKSLVAMRWGGALVVDTRDMLLAPALLLEGIWEPDITNWLMRTLGRGDVFVDVGANIGYYAFLARRIVGDAGRVIAVEAHPEMASLLKRNMLMNGYRDVLVIEKAAWSEATTLEFHLRKNFGVNSSVGSLGGDQLAVHSDEERVIDVDAVTLDEVLANTDRIAVLKLDVEGSEFHALQGLTRTLDRNPTLVIMMEWCPGQLEMVGSSPRALVDFLAARQMQCAVFELGLSIIGVSELLAMDYANVVLSRTL